MKKLIQKFFNIFGYKINKIEKGKYFYNGYDKHLGYEFEDDANKLIYKVRNYTMLPHVNLLTLYEHVKYCEKYNIEGDFVECGVWKGGAVGLMALANQMLSSKRRNLHLFDAFEEICAPNEEIDGEVAINEVKKILGNNALIEGELKPLKGIYDNLGGPGNISECKEIIEKIIGYPENYVSYHKGWFQDTVPVVAKKMGKIAILRLDGDWYESTKVCIENLFDKVVKNGFIIFDDYGLYEGCKKAVDEFLLKRKEKYFLNYSSWSCRYLQKN